MNSEALYKKNREFFKSCSDVLYRTIFMEEPLIHSTVKDVEGQYNLLVENGKTKCFLHSIYDIPKEMEHMLEPVDKDTRTVVLFGSGCWHAVKYLFDNFNKLENLILIEPDLNVFRSVLYKVDITGDLKKNVNITFIINKSGEEAAGLLSDVLFSHYRDQVSFAFHISCRALNPGYYEHLVNSVVKHFRFRTINIATNHGTLHLYTVNMLRNITMANTPAEFLMQELNKWNIPAIIVSAGPSLEKNMHLLKEIGNRALIVSVGSATRILDANKIVPHLRMAIDGFPSECIFEGIDTAAAPLIYCDKVHFDVLRKYDGEKIKMVLDTDLITQYIYARIHKPHKQTRSGFSVANIALDFLCRSGCKKIILIGQDLCYTNNKLYADGAIGNYSVDEIEQKYTREKDIYGNDVYTMQGFQGIRSVFEKFILDYEDVEFINATEGGLNIKGTVNLKLEDAIGGLLVEYDLSGIIRGALTQKQDYHDYNESIKAGLSIMKDEAQQILKENNLRVEKLYELKQKYDEGAAADYIINELNTLAIHEQKLSKIDLYNVVFLPGLIGTFGSLALYYNKRGMDKEQAVQSNIEALIGQSTEVYFYAKLIEELIDEKHL